MSKSSFLQDLRRATYDRYRLKSLISQHKVGFLEEVPAEVRALVNQLSNARYRSSVAESNARKFGATNVDVVRAKNDGYCDASAF